MNDLRGPDAEKIRSMFSAIAQRYDRANTVLSVGVHHLWRKRLVNWSEVKTGGQVLDCATGTGDLALEFKKVVGPSGRVVATDFCVDMLEPGRAKAQAQNCEILFAQADVTSLPYGNGVFDVASISFGIRNVENPLQALRELGRVVRPGGSVMILEFGQPQVPVLRQAFALYSRSVLPRIGGWITGHREAYQYLQNSSSAFPCGAEFAELLKSVPHFANVEYRSLTGGIAYLYKATKIAN